MQLTRYAIVVTLLACFTPATFAASLADFEERTVASSSYPYRLYIPPNLDPTKSYPIITYYHSSGQSSAASTVGHPNVTSCLTWAKDPDHEAFVFVPFSYSTQSMIDVFDDLTTEFGARVDRTRVYTTGWSLGAINSFTAIGSRPEEFAAAAPMAGWTTRPAENYVDTPIWAFNGDQDYTTPPSGVLPTFTEAWALGSKVLFTEVGGGTHSTTPRTGYAEPGLFPWMFAQSTTIPTDLSMFVGWDKTVNETLDITGPAQSITRTDEFFIGYYGTGNLNITDGAVLNNKAGYVAVDGASNGNVTISGTGSQWNTDGHLYLGYRGGAQASLTVEPGSQVNVTDKLIVIPGSELVLNGGEINADSLALDGYLRVDLEALAQPGAGKLNVNGFAKMNGVLDVILPADLNSILGETVTIATFASHSDDMRGLTYTDLGNDLILAPSLTATELAVTVTYMGDANLDGMVSLIDLDILGQNYNTSCTTTFACGDFTGNGTVSLLDLNVLGENWGLGTSSVPEPTSLALLATAAAITFRRKQ